MARSQKFSNLALVFLTGGGLHRRLLLVAFALLAPFVPVAIASGDGGALDPSFGTGGRVTTDFRPSPEFRFSSGGAAAIAIQGDGKMVAAGFAQPFRGATATEFAFARYNIDGSLDTSFGDGGEVTTEFGGGFDAITRVFAVAIQRDGKIIAAGETGSFRSGADFALARYNSDGSLDATFGDGGKATTHFSGSGNFDGATAVAIQGDGKIIVVGFGGGGVALARYETDGSLDPSFGDGGKVNNLSLRMGVTAAAIQRDGQIVVGGFAVNRELDFALARFNNDGSLDTSFGSGGEVTTDFGGNGDVSQGIAIQMNGRIVAVGYTEGDTDTDFALARYKTDGTIEKSFGRAGRVTTDFNGTRDSAAAVAIQRNGRIVAAGQTDGGAGGDFALARYKTNGSLDRSFGSGGKISTDFGGDDAAQALAIQTDGRLVAAGFTFVGGGSSFALARYLAR